jgi:hypothetical protein
MKRSTSLVSLLLLLFMARQTMAQLIVTISTPTQCYSSGGNGALGQVAVFPPGAVSYSWNIISPASPCAPASIMPLAPDGSVVGFNFFCCGVYTIDCTAFNGQGMPVGNDIITSTIVCAPSLTLGTLPSGSVICSGSATLTASGGPTYTWLPGNANGASITPTATGCYTVTSSVNGCTAEAVSCITVQPLSFSVSPVTKTLCIGTGATFTASGAGTYSWSNGAITSTMTASPTITTVYTVTGSIGSCSDTKTVQLNVNPSPSVNVSSNKPVICKGNSATLTATGGSLYAWSSTTLTMGSIVISPTTTTGYTVATTNSVGCMAKAVVTQSVNSCVGIEQAENATLIAAVYPNPTSGLFALRLYPGLGPVQLNLYDQLGQLILSRSIDSEFSEINISRYPAGVYHMALKSDNTRTVYSIIKIAD